MSNERYTAAGTQGTHTTHTNCSMRTIYLIQQIVWFCRDAVREERQHRAAMVARGRDASDVMSHKSTYLLFSWCVINWSHHTPWHVPSRLLFSLPHSWHSFAPIIRSVRIVILFTHFYLYIFMHARKQLNYWHVYTAYRPGYEAVSSVCVCARAIGQQELSEWPLGWLWLCSILLYVPETFRT